MMLARLVFFVAFFLLINPGLVFAELVSAEETKITIRVVQTLDVEVVPEDKTLRLELGEKGGTWVKIINKGNIRDVIGVEGSVEKEQEGWIYFEFICPEAIGICSGTNVTDVRLTPEVRETQVYLEAVSYKPGSFEDVIEIYAYSQTKPLITKNETITIVAEPPGGAGPFGAPALDSIWFVLAFLLACYIYMNKDLLKK